MSWLAPLLARRRLILASALLLAAAGIASWHTMPREEDPQFPERNALVLVPFPGADAETVERLVVEPIEERLAEVDEVGLVLSTSRASIAIVRIELRDSIYETDEAWNEVEDAIDRSRADFPSGAGEPSIDHDLIAQEAVILALTGASDPLVLLRAAEDLERHLLAIPGVRRIKVIADPGERIYVEYDDAVARRLGLDPRLLALQLSGRSAIVPGGLIHLGERTVTLRPRTELGSVEEIESTPIVLPSGTAVPLAEIARVRRGPAEPAAERMRWQGASAVGLGVIPRDGQDSVAFGDRIRERIAELAPQFAPLVIDEVVFQPDQVRFRLDDLSRSLLLGILIVTAVLFAFMGPRMGVLVAVVVPLVAFASIAVYAAGGGILHQISIAALVIALGMLVDNAIVMAESIQWRLDAGDEPRAATVGAVRELALPLGTATGTTVAAFVPMLVSRGPTADFTRSLPILIILALLVSYLFAVLVTPALARLALRRRRRGSSAQRWPARIADLAIRRWGVVLIAAAILLALTLAAAGRVDHQFFPPADRDVALVELVLPEGTHLEGTDAAARRLEAALAEHPHVRSVATFLGRAAPRFYYNLLGKPSSPHRGELVVEATAIEHIEEVLAYARDFARRELPQAEVVGRRLAQGPPVDSPIEIRLFGEDLDGLAAAADQVLAEVRATPGSRDARHDLSSGAPTVRFEIDDAAAGRHGLSRTDVALALVGRTLGSEVGQYRAGPDPVPIVVRSRAGEELPVAALETVDVATPGGQPVPLAQLAKLHVEWRPAAIYHRQGQRLVTVHAETAAGVTFHQVLNGLTPRLDELELPPGVRWELGGEAEESGAANSAILSALPLGALLLLFFLLAEFNSFRRVAIVLATVPLAAVGVVPGLLLSGQPFGFMSMLGVVALVGIVVNNAIVLLDVVETHRREGAGIEEALAAAVIRRTRPILLTMATTVAGLSPLAFSATSLWPPLAWAMISGLLASTLLTLLVVPALYKLLFALPTGRLPRWPRRRAAATAALVALLAAPALRAEEPAEASSTTVVRLGLDEAMTRAAERPAASAGRLRADAAELAGLAERRRTWWPTFGVSGDAVWRDRDFSFTTPLGSLTLGERHSVALNAELRQPLLDPAAALYAVPATRAEADAARATDTRLRQRLAATAADAYLEVLAVDARLAATDAFIVSLDARLDEVRERFAAGRVLETDALKIEIDLDAAELDRRRLRHARELATDALGIAVGLAAGAEPADEPSTPPDPPSLAELVHRAARRPDVVAATSQVAALELRARQARAAHLPRLEARVRYSTTDGDPFRPEEIAEGAVEVSWRPFAGGTRRPRAAALEAEAEAAAADLAELERAVRLEVRQALLALDDARVAVDVRRRGVDLATETARVETERHAAGRATTNDLLAAEAALRDQRTRHELARLDAVRAWIRLELAVGSPV